MRHLSLLFLCLAACGPSRASDLFPRYAVLTSFGPEAPLLYRQVERLARYRHAEILKFEDIRSTRGWLSSYRPDYVAVFVRPRELDANFQLSMLETACRIDGDPFPDFTFGYFLAADRKLLERQIDSLMGAEARLDKRLVQVTYADFSASEPASQKRRLSWATGLPLHVLGLPPGDPDSLEKHRADLTAGDILMLSGEGDPSGITGFPPSEVRKLKLESMVVFSAADLTGAAGSAFDTVAGRARKRSVRREDSFVLTVLRNGCPVLLAPLQDSVPDFVGNEWTDMILSEAPFGEVMKHTYEYAILSAGGGTPSFDRYRDGQALPTGADGPAYLGATRVLYGDPLLRLFRRKTVTPLREVARNVTTDTPGRIRFLNVRYQVTSADCLPFFQDASPGHQKIHLRIPLPADARGAEAEFKGCVVGNQTVPAAMVAQAVEVVNGTRVAHVLIRGENLAQKGLLVQVTLRLR